VPITNTTFVRTTAIFLLVGMLALAAIVGTTIWLVQVNQASFDESVLARTARAATVNLRNALSQAESAQRGFVLTGDPAYLEPYETFTPQVPMLVERMADLLSPYPEATQPMALLRQDLDEKLAEMASTVELMQAGQADEALDVIRTDRGREASVRSQALFDAIIAEADSRIGAGLDDQRNAIQGLRWVTIIGAFLIFAGVAGAAWVVMRYTRELAEAREEIAQANSGLEARVAERTQDLGRANEEIQRFAYIVTHDLRAPLVNIMGFTSELESSVGTLSAYMKDRPGEDNESRAAREAATEDLPEAITFIRAATKKMDGLINAILKISREGRRQLRPETVDLEDLASGSASAIQHQVVDNGGEIITDIAVPKIVSDRMSLEQVLGNLLDNAVKYREPERPLRVNIGARHVLGNRVEITVADNGRGIAPTDHERVFELFRRSGTQSQPGEGIGLAHVRTMVRSLGGDITLQSELGQGTTFTISLPRDLRIFLGNTRP
jgi:signal transduction histidine kinase